MNVTNTILRQLEELISSSRFQEVESDTLELKPVPADSGSWKECHKSVNAFLNTRGGILILGIKEEGQGNSRRYVFTGYQEQAEPKLKDLSTLFSDRQGRKLMLTACFPTPEIRPFLSGRVCIVYVDELSADQKYCYLDGAAYKRILTGDHRISEPEIDAHEEYKQEIWNARELQPVLDATPADLDIDRLNEYIQLLNRSVRVETIKPDISAALPFLERKYFIRNGVVTTLGMLVCGRHPGDFLGFRCQLHGYVDVPNEIALDKQDLTDNVLPLMEGGLAFILRNIHVGVSPALGGIARPQYPELLLRETVNNALAHRDYSVDRQVIIIITPGQHIQIHNPGSFRPNLLIQFRNQAAPILRILPEAKPRNPKLADVLRVYRKWEGRGIGMATLVNYCLQDELNLPFYRLHQDEVRLYLTAGKLLDQKMERLFEAFNAYIGRKVGGSLSVEQKLVMSYLIKSEWANAQQQHTILLTADNNHFSEIVNLERAGLIYRHEVSPDLYPVYVADRELMRTDYSVELREMFGDAFGELSPLHQEILSLGYRVSRYSHDRTLTAKRASYALWANIGEQADNVREFDRFYRRVRHAFNRLYNAGFLTRQAKPGYLLNHDYRSERLL